MTVEPKDPQAHIRRRQALEDAQRVYDLCDCSYPLVRYRNGHGHDPDCPIATYASREVPK